MAPTEDTPQPRRTDSNLVDHARRELRIIGEDPETARGIVRVVRAFADMGHSGTSAHHCAALLDKLLRFQPLTDLTDDPDEWIDRHAEGMTPTPLWQSKRNSEAFSTDGGKTYTLLSEQEAAGDIATTPLHRSKQMARVAAEEAAKERLKGVGDWFDGVRSQAQMRRDGA
ncbi:hypothetical protein OOK48_35345 [Streptomyces viridodiastaticus]|uniref:hypothetical protein n=1 Tax=Streptomyces albogriseolus TaxID=1887 RepID=UPI00225ACE7D|nr:hypothetical protein [Streptomyces viridodiastaticus]MCX4571598.1 hypothetical protein [Streptomyces viridodiastaticus]